MMQDMQLMMLGYEKPTYKQKKHNLEYELYLKSENIVRLTKG
ncbi:MAG: hypothetical protein SCL54_03005 [Bacillota bacterium]|jgi:hypothetical protein|nr:hypothetical protein [Bacillota bacterium]